MWLECGHGMLWYYGHTWSYCSNLFVKFPVKFPWYCNYPGWKDQKGWAVDVHHPNILLRVLIHAIKWTACLCSILFIHSSSKAKDTSQFCIHFCASFLIHESWKSVNILGLFLKQLLQVLWVGPKLGTLFGVPKIHRLNMFEWSI